MKELNELYLKVKSKNTKFIIISGGVLSGLGKGIALASIGKLISKDLKKTPIKCDGYLNYDPGTMNPIEHGEVFVLDDGCEVDMDFGHYERFLDITCNKNQNITMGKIYKEIIELERKGKYLGKTVKLIPEVTNYIEQKILNITIENNSEIVLLEIGGTIGDLENELYVYAIKNIIQRLKNNTYKIHLTYIPELSFSNEQKTKPAQKSISELFKRNIIPDLIICRTNKELDSKSKQKISEFSCIPTDNIISAKDLDNVYEIPIEFKKQNVDKMICNKLNIGYNKEFNKYEENIKKLTNFKLNINNTEKINIGICGKYTDLKDSYASVIEAINHSSIINNIDVNIEIINTEKIHLNELKNLDGIIVPGGFGKRGILGKIQTIKFARENKIPFLGLCYGLQLAIIEFAQNVCNIKNANSTEIDPNTKEPIIKILDNQDLNNLGGSMRLGSYKAIINKNTKTYKIYNNSEVYERHRHRYEVNPNYHKILEDNNLIISGKSPNGKLVEFIELEDHPFFIATQAHPELKSTIENAHPLFIKFVEECENRHNKKRKEIKIIN
jgi:CTP synthase